MPHEFAVRGQGAQAYAIRLFSTKDRRLRLRSTWLVVCFSALAGCAATGPEKVAEAPPPPVVAPPPAVAAAPEPPPPAVPKPREPEFFPAAVGADLEPLHVPVGDIWERIVAGYAIPDLNGPLVEKWEQWYSARPDYVARMVDRSRRYLYHIVTEVSDRRMPMEIALLPMIESAYNPTAVSSARAAGIWQFMPSTGKHYGLEQNFWVDSRLDVLAATDKALDYLTKLHGDFGDWQLALAGYNWGEGNVAKALARSKAKGLPPDYSNLAMPDETRNYLPKLQAVKNIVRDPEKYGLVLADIPDAPFFAVVKIDKKMDTRRAAQLAELSFDEFVALNPQHNRPVMAGANEHSILLPIDRAEIFAAKLDLVDQPLVSWQAYRLKPKETLQQVAAKYGMSVETLRAINGISARSRVPAGHVLLVPAERSSTEAALTLTQAVFTTVPAGRTSYYTVQKGDTLLRIAARHSVTVSELKGWNGLRRDSVFAGQKLRVTSDVVPVSRSGGRTKRAVATRGAGKKPAAAKSGPPATARSNGSPGG